MNKSKLEYNWQVAFDALEAVDWQLPYGALNRPQADKQLPQAVLKQQLGLIRELRHRIKSNPNNALECLFQLKGGFCWEIATIALSHIRTRHPQAQVEVMHVNDHQLLCIGREPGADTHKPETWGKDAVICDPWAGKIYQAQDFDKQKRPENDIKYFKMGVERKNLNKEHYLAGVPHFFNERNIPMRGGGNPVNDKGAVPRHGSPKGA